MDDWGNKRTKSGLRHVSVTDLKGLKGSVKSVVKRCCHEGIGAAEMHSA
jgi:hypothetical protein